MVGGLITAVKFVSDTNRPHIETGHAKMGVTTLALTACTPVLGVLADLFWNPDRKKIPIFPDKLHWVFGYSCLLLAAVTLFTGLKIFRASELIFGLCGAWLGLIVIAFVFMMVRGKRKSDLAIAHSKPHSRAHGVLEDAARGDGMVSNVPKGASRPEKGGDGDNNGIRQRPSLSSGAPTSEPAHVRGTEGGDADNPGRTTGDRSSEPPARRRSITKIIGSLVRQASNESMFSSGKGKGHADDGKFTLIPLAAMQADHGAVVDAASLEGSVDLDLVLAEPDEMPLGGSGGGGGGSSSDDSGGASDGGGSGDGNGNGNGNGNGDMSTDLAPDGQPKAARLVMQSPVGKDSDDEHGDSSNV